VPNVAGTSKLGQFSDAPKLMPPKMVHRIEVPLEYGRSAPNTVQQLPLVARFADLRATSKHCPTF
jgi:hypothetical protein